MIRSKFRMSVRDSRRSLGCSVTYGIYAWRETTMEGLRSIGGDYKRTTMRMAQLYGPLKTRRCITLQSTRARCNRVSEDPSCLVHMLGSAARLQRRDKHGCLLISPTWASLHFVSLAQPREIPTRIAGNCLDYCAVCICKMLRNF